MILQNINRLLLLYFAILFISIYSCNSKPNRFKEKQNNKEEHINLNDSLPHKINFRIFIENSASMDGYVSTETDFKNTVYSLITDLKAKQIANAIELNYINDKICNLKTNAIPEDIEYFIKNLNPKTFKNNSCSSKRGSTYVPDIINQVINLKDNEVSILVSDFIFSSGNNSKSFLTQQSNSIEMLMSQEFKSKDISSIIYKCNSNFIGTYYKESAGGSKEQLNGRRPYYIMIFGSNKSLDNFLTEVNFNNYKGFESSYFLLTPRADKPNSKILRINKKGKFEIEVPATKLIINKVSTDENRLFQFSIASNLNFHKMDDSFLINPNNYELSSNYKLVSISKITDETDESLKGYSHIFTIQSNNVKDNQEVNIKFKSKFPSWVKESSTEDDSNPKSYESQTKTFGFSYLVEGISQAYENKYKGKEQFGITIKVSKNNFNSKPNSAGIPWLLIICILAISLSSIYFKIKK